MGTNKDQLQAHQFMLQRVISALAVQETDPEQPPFRRPTMAAIAGIVIGILSCGAVWVFGLLVPGGNQFTATDVVAIEEETGARFVLIDGQLHPVANFSSALLALDKHADVRMVSHSTLAGIPAGAPIGIPDAPDSLPGKDQLLAGDWTVCSQSTADAQGQRTNTTVLLVGHRPERSSSLGGTAVVVQAGTREYLLYQGFRHEMSRNVELAIGLNGVSVIGVDPTWLDTIPLGEPITPVPVAGVGKASTALPGRALVAGQLLEVADGPGTGLDDVTEHQFYLVQPNQLMAISPLQARVQQLTPQANPPIPISNAELTNAVRSAPGVVAENAAPRSRPRFAPIDNPTAPICAAFRPGETHPQLLIGASLSATDRGVGGTAPAKGAVRVAVPPRQGVLVEVMAGPDEPAGGGTIGLVTDQGRFYPFADPQHIEQVLGYDGVVPVRISPQLGNRVPRAGALSTDAARLPVTSGG